MIDKGEAEGRTLGMQSGIRDQVPGSGSNNALSNSLPMHLTHILYSMEPWSQMYEWANQG